MPDAYHAMCIKAIEQWQAGDVGTTYVAYICNMVDSRNLALVEWLHLVARSI